LLAFGLLELESEGGEDFGEIGSQWCDFLGRGQISVRRKGRLSLGSEKSPPGAKGEIWKDHRCPEGWRLNVREESCGHFGRKKS